MCEKHGEEVSLDTSPFHGKHLCFETIHNQLEGFSYFNSGVLAFGYGRRHPGRLAAMHGPIQGVLFIVSTASDTADYIRLLSSLSACHGIFQASTHMKTDQPCSFQSFTLMSKHLSFL